MSFNNTTTPRKPKGKAKYQLPMRATKWGRQEYYMTPELEALFIKLFPVTMNPDLMKLFGISFSMVQRFKHEYGLEKDMDVINKKHGQQIRRTNIKSGLYDRMRGIAPSQACRDAYRRKCEEEGYHPLREMKKNSPRRYAAFCKKCSDARKEMIRRDKRRIDIGLSPMTRLHLPQYKYTKVQLSKRYSALKRGYLIGNVSESSGQRYVIYWDAETTRSELFERNCMKVGFAIQEYKQ